MEDRTSTWALKAARWAVQTHPAFDPMTNFEVLLRGAERAAMKRGRYTIMRNQLTLGMNNNYWPCLSRLMIMASPWLAGYIHPRHTVQLDSVSGVAFMGRIYRDVTGEGPKVGNWQTARQRTEVGAQ